MELISSKSIWDGAFHPMVVEIRVYVASVYLRGVDCCDPKNRHQETAVSCLCVGAARWSDLS
jgi:hypothetical protein